jgi:hypothetical protein
VCLKDILVKSGKRRQDQRQQILMTVKNGSGRLCSMPAQCSVVIVPNMDGFAQ